MSLLGDYTDKEFTADFPLDFGSGIRGDYIETDQEKVGLIFAHQRGNGKVCGGTLYWETPQKEVVVPLWGVVSIEPLTLANPIGCDCGLRGVICDGIFSSIEAMTTA